MKIVIAGATGLIGRNLSESLLTDGHSVVVLTRRTNRIREPRAGFQAVQWDAKTLGGWCKQLEDADAVVNLCGESLAAGRWTSRRRTLLMTSRIEPTRTLVQAIGATATKPKVLLNASAIGYYGPVMEGEVSEESPAGQDFVSNLCVQWEHAALTAERIGARVVLLRSGLVLDPLGGALKRMLLPYRFFAGGLLGSGSQWMSWIHQIDEIRAIRFLLETPAVAGPVNLTAPAAVRMREFNVVLATVLRRPSWLSVPGFALKMFFGEMSDVILTGQRVLPRKLEKAGFEFRYPALKPALEDLLSESGKQGINTEGRGS